MKKQSIETITGVIVETAEEISKNLNEFKKELDTLQY